MKYIQFALIDGNLVYRNTGRYYNKSYTIKGNTVYHNGRKIGNIGKPNKKQQSIIDRAKKNREKKAKKEVEKFVKDKRIPESKNKLSYQDLAEIQPIVNDIKQIDQISKTEQELYNLSKQLFDMVQSGKMSKDEAEKIFREWMDAPDKATRTKIWNKLKSRQKDKGYTPPSP